MPHVKVAASQPNSLCDANQMSNLFPVLSFIGKDRIAKSAEDVGHFLGIAHEQQAYERGTRRIAQLMKAGMLELGAERDPKGRARYNLSELGKQAVAKKKALGPLQGIPSVLKVEPIEARPKET